MTALKKVLTSLLLISFLVGCSNEDKLDVAEENTVEEVKDVQKENVAVKEEEATTPEDNETVTSKQEEAKYQIDPNNWSVVPIGDANKDVVLLTIDDAPDKYALDMAKTLHGLGVNAIFFVNGHFLDTEEEALVLKEIYDLGFPIGNHTYSHSNLSDVSIEEQANEIISLNDRVEEITGERPKFFRAPFGVNTDDSRRIAAEENMLIMNWTYGYDWEKEYQSKEALTDIMVNSPYLRSGANLLMHDREWTNQAMGDIVKGLQAKGFEIVDPKLISTPK